MFLSDFAIVASSAVMFRDYPKDDAHLLAVDTLHDYLFAAVVAHLYSALPSNF